MSTDPKLQDENKTPATPTTPEDGDKGGENGGTQTLTQEQFDKALKERLSREKEKFDKQMKDEIAKAISETERRTKLSAEEKEKELQAEKEAELAAKQRELTLRENKLDAQSKLNEYGMPIKFADFIVGEDKEKMFSVIDEIKELWTKAIADGVAEKLKGAPGKDPNGNSDNKNAGSESASFAF